MAITLAEAVIRVVGDSSGIRREFVRAEQIGQDSARRLSTAVSRQFDAALRTMATRAAAVGRTLSLALTTPLVAIGGAGVKAAVDFETALSRIVGLVGLSRQEVEGFRAAILALGPEVGRGPRELAEALFFITSAGASGRQALDILRVSAQAATAGLGETKVIADAVTSAVNAYGAANLSASRATAILTAAVREGKAEADAIAPVLGRIIPVAAELGVSFDQVGAAIAAMTRLGADASEAATALRGIMATVLRPSKQAEDALKAVGLSSAVLRRAIREEGLLAVLLALRQRFGDNEEALTRIFPNIRALTGVLNLVGENAAETARIFRALAQTTDADLAQAFSTAASTTGVQLAQMRAAIERLAITASTLLLPVVMQLAGHLTALANAFASLPPGTQRAIVQFLALAAVVGPLLLVASALIKALLGLKTALAVVAAVAGAVLTPVGAAAAALAVAVGVLGRAWVTNWRGIREAVQRVAPPIAQLIESIIVPVVAATRAIEGLGAVVRRLAQGFGVVGREARGFPADFRARTVAQERRALLTPQQRAVEQATREAQELQAQLQRILSQAGPAAVGAEGAGRPNVALQRALAMFDLIRERDQLTTRQQIQSLERIRDTHARTIDERIDLETQLARLRNQLAHETADRSRQAVEESLRFIQTRLIAGGAPVEETIAAFERVVSRIRRATDQEFGTREARLEALRRVERDFSDVIFRERLDATRRVAEIQRDLAVELERLTLDETEVERREITRRFDERRREVQQRLTLATEAAAALQAIEQGRAAALADLERRAQERRLADAVREADAQAALGRASLAEQVAARRLVLEVTRDRVRRLEIEREIRDLILQGAQQEIELADARARLGERITHEQIAARRRLLEVLRQQGAEERTLREAQRELNDLVRQFIEQLARGDVTLAFRVAINEVVAGTFDALEAARALFRTIQDGIASALRAAVLEGKSALETLRAIAFTVVEAIFTQLTQQLAHQLTQRLAQALSVRIPTLAQLVPEAQATVAAGAQTAAAITTAGTTAAAAMTTAGSGFSGAVVAAGTTVAQALIAAGQAAAAAIAAAVGQQSLLRLLPALQGGGSIAAPTVALLHPREVVLPLPRGLTPGRLAEAVDALAAGGVGGPVTVTINATVREDTDIRRIRDAVADAMDLARRAHHPFFRR